MDSARGTAALPAVGFPIRTSPDQSLGRFDLPTPLLSSVCSNHLSYRPLPRPSAPGSQRTKRRARSLKTGQAAHERLRTPFDLLLLPSRRRRAKLLRKEVIQPPVPL